jgi:hypothetical protein
MNLIKIKIINCSVKTYWYNDLVDTWKHRDKKNAFYAIKSKNAHNLPAYAIMELSPYTDTFIDTLKRVNSTDAIEIDTLNIEIVKS